MCSFKAERRSAATNSNFRQRLGETLRVHAQDNLENGGSSMRLPIEGVDFLRADVAQE